MLRGDKLRAKLTASLPVESDQLHSSAPVSMGFVIRGRNPRSFWINSYHVCAIVFDQVKHSITLEHLVGHIFRKRKHVHGCVLLLLVDSATFDADCINKHRD